MAIFLKKNLGTYVGNVTNILIKRKFKSERWSIQGNDHSSTLR